MRKPRIFGDRFAPSPVLFDMIRSSVIELLVGLTANLPGWIAVD
jgi:hypothetical protein